MTLRWRPIALSGKQRKAAERLAEDEERDATGYERRVAELLLGEAAAAADLVLVKVVVAMLRRPRTLALLGIYIHDFQNSFKAEPRINRDVGLPN